MTRETAERCWATLPAALLAVVACAQVVAAHTTGLSPWKGGGFGMFASLDARPFRYVRIFVRAPERSEELAVTPSLEYVAAAAAISPTTAQLERLARAVVAREHRHERRVDTVTLEVWRVEFAPGTLVPHERRMREHEHRAAR